MRTRLAGCLLAASVLTGCPADRPDYADEPLEPYEELAQAAAEDTAREFATPRPVAVTPVQGGRTAAGALTATGSLQGVGEEAVGALTITEANGGTLVQVTAHRFAAATEFQAIVARGACGGQAIPVHLIGSPTTVGPEGIANLEARVPVPTAELLNGEHSIRLVNPEAAGQQPGAPEMVFACADLPVVTGNTEQGTGNR